jgi:LmbE family N-acetylglucosaminyl deacetylase
MGLGTARTGGPTVTPVLVTLHAHPDDESIFTGGTIATAIEAGWRVVLVVATDGDQGERPSSVGRDLGAHRRAEVLEAATVLGIARVEFLGYGDSGHTTPVSDAAPHGSLAAAPVGAPAAAVRRLLVEERATALTAYDAGGIYGHVDHVRVHEIGVRSVVGTDCELYEATVSRSELRRLRRDLVDRGLLDASWPSGLSERLGVEVGPDLVGVDVTRHLPVKLAAVSAHSSQVMEADSFMGLPAGAFHHLFATEWFRVARAGRGRFLEMVGAADVPGGTSSGATQLGLAVTG